MSDETRHVSITRAAHDALQQELAAAKDAVAELERKLVGAERDLRKKSERISWLESMINNPEIEDFILGMRLEATHQVERWGVAHDEGKNPPDWFWLLGFLAGKALHHAEMAKAGSAEHHLAKTRHHIISSAAVLLNWHRYVCGANDMRPGIAAPKDKPL